MSTVDAGDFDSWLSLATASLQSGSPMPVPCGDCRGCCSAGQFIAVTVSDVAARSQIPKALLTPATGATDGTQVMGYTDTGLCPMLKGGNCSIYTSRPATCRQFDCRVLSAAGLQLQGRWAERINQRVDAWRFSFATEAGRSSFHAVRAAARFIATHAAHFPGGRVPARPTDLAVLALKVYPAFLSGTPQLAAAAQAQAVINLSTAFEARRQKAGAAPP